MVALWVQMAPANPTTLKAISGLLKPEDGEVTDGEIIFKGKKDLRSGCRPSLKSGISRSWKDGAFLGTSAWRKICCRWMHRKDKGVRRIEVGLGIFPAPARTLPRKLPVIWSEANTDAGNRRALMPGLVDHVGRAFVGRAAPAGRRYFSDHSPASTPNRGRRVLLVERNARSRGRPGCGNYACIMENGRVCLPRTHPTQNSADVREFYAGLNEMVRARAIATSNIMNAANAWLS